MATPVICGVPTGTYHNVVKHIDEICDAVLYHYRYHQSQKPLIKGFITDQCFNHTLTVSFDIIRTIISQTRFIVN